MTLHEVENYVRHFVQKSVQVVVHSRLGLDIVQCNGNSTGKEWFSLKIPDLKEVTVSTKKCLDSLATEDPEHSNSKFTLTHDWKICCEISLNNSDGESMSLEYWVFSNEALYSSIGQQKVADDETFDIYNRMGLLLKSIISLTRVTPARKLSSKGQGADTYVICYRVFSTELTTDQLISSVSDRKRYSPEIKLGSVGTPFSRLSVYFTYRTSVTSDPTTDANLMPVKVDHFTAETPKVNTCHTSDTICYDKRRPAFASSSTVESKCLHLLIQCHSLSHPPSTGTKGDALELIPENTLINLLPSEPLKPIEEVVQHDAKSPTKDNTGSVNETSAIGGQIISRESKITSSDDSYVFVEPIPPFASTDQKSLSSFFNGPAPSFSESEKFALQVSEIEEKLRDIELNIPTWDSFVDSICSSNADDE